MHISSLENRMTRGRTATQAGFSLVELLIAMTITLIISGAIYGLLSGGQSAFRREPELTDRQQNARVAMNVIMRDIENAGSVGTSAGTNRPFVQVFKTGLNACTGCPDGGSPNSADNVATDEIEMITNTGTLENEAVCTDGTTANGGTTTNVQLMRPVTIPANTVVMVFMADDTWTLRTVTSSSVVHDTVALPGGCNDTNTLGSPFPAAAAVGHTQLNFANGDVNALNTATGPCNTNGWGSVAANTSCVVANISFANVVRYRIRNDASGVPNLQRWSSDAPSAFTGAAAALAAYQTVARGIEDLQVRYHNVGTTATPGTWTVSAPAVTVGTYSTLIDQVEVTLTARSEARNIQGARNSASGRRNIRGSLTSTGTPRATLFNMANAPSPSAKPWF
jgi:type IV pilus assembly protein PilW